MASQQLHQYHPNHKSLTKLDLRCIICNGTYSDLSHLLTHLASKGHLSKKDNLLKRSQKDIPAAMQLRKFDFWYNQHNIGILETERLDQKDAKKVARDASKPKPSKRSKPAASHHRSPSSNARGMSNPYPMMDGSQSFGRGSIDPQLDGTIKTEPDTRSATPSMLSYASYGSSTMHQHYPQSMGASYTSWSPGRIPSVLDNADTSSGGSVYGEIEPSTTSRKRKHAGDASTHQADDRDTESAVINGRVVVVPITRPSYKIKEIPFGVHEFDCATPEGKRVRNQKKDGSVLKGLEANSKKSSPFEMVFKGGDLLVERLITGQPDCDPLDTSGETEPEADIQPPKKKKKRTARKPRAPLSKKSTNTGRASRRDSHHDDSTELPPSTSYFDSSEADYPSYDIPARSRPRQGGLRIHNDNSGPAITLNGGSMHSSMSSHMPILTSGLQQIVPPNDPFHHYGPHSFQHGGNRVPQNPMASFLNNANPRPAFNGQNGSMPTSPYFSNMGNMGMGMTFGSFGQINSLAVSNTFGNNNPLAYSVGPATQHNSNSMIPQSHNSNTNFFHGPSMNNMQHVDNFESFSTNDTEMLPTGGFNLNATYNNAANDLFFPQSARGDDDDDGATISLPASER